MKVQQFSLDTSGSIEDLVAGLTLFDPHLILGFARFDLIKSLALPSRIATAMPKAISVGCSTDGAISAANAICDTAVVTAIRFERPDLAVAATEVANMSDSEDAGARVGAAIRARKPHTVMLLGQGVDLNGSAVIRGLRRELGPDVTLIGGLANDGGKFAETLVYVGADVAANKMVAIGFCDPNLVVSHGSVGGWCPFGAVRRVTRASGNVLYELDGEPALAIYKRYLGDQAAHLPGSALLFPFSMLDHVAQETGVTRTILGIDEAAGSITLAGEIVEQGYLRLMCANHEDLINGAELAAEEARGPADSTQSTSFALLVSCIGRLMTLGQRAEEEVDAVGAILGSQCLLTGFYSNGEISARSSTPEQQLHNQTMTVTRFREAA